MPTIELCRKIIATSTSSRLLAFSAALAVAACQGSDDPTPNPSSGQGPGAGVLGTLDSGVVLADASTASPGSAGGTTSGGSGSSGTTAGASTGTAPGGSTMGTGSTSTDGGASSSGGSTSGTMGGGTAGTSDAGADAGSSGSSADAGTDAAPMMHMDLGQGDGKDVITIGDSYMSLFLSGIQQSLEKVSMRDYRNYAVPGTLVLNEQIPNQYEDAKRADPDIKTVVMTGGGNDILTASCSGNCKELVDMVSARFDKMLMEMGKDGVADVVLISYGYPADQSRRASLDYSRMLLPTKCLKTGMPRCHFIDPVKELDGKISSDGIHPTDAGYDLLGKMVWDLMKAEGMRR